MKLSQFKSHLSQVKEIAISLPNGTMVPSHFHITEIGLINKDFIDCGGIVRSEKVANFQLWEANDFDHRLAPDKLLGIIAQSEKILGKDDLEVEVEYQTETIGKYALGFENGHFKLIAKQTNCLASDSCGVPADKRKVTIAEKVAENSCCTPGGGCC